MKLSKDMPYYEVRFHRMRATGKKILHKTPFLLIWLLYAQFHVFCQKGDPFITNYYIEQSDNDNHCYAIIQDEEEVMLFATRKGIVSFDGHAWGNISTPDIPFSFCKDTMTKKIFVGCRNGFGYIQKDLKGQYHYHSLSDHIEETGNISNIQTAGDDIVFYSDQMFIMANRENPAEIKIWNHKASEIFTGIIILNGNIYINVMKLGLNRLTNKGLAPLPKGDLLENSKILFSLVYDSKRVLVGTSENKLYLFDGKDFQQATTDVDAYLSESVVAGGVNLGNKSFVLSTVTGGCVIIRKKDFKSLHIINYQTGLPDDEIFSLGIDNKKGLWAAHEYGFSRIDNTLPVRNYSNYPGLEGNLISMTRYDSSMYVSTSEGVYYLTKVKNYKEIEVLVELHEKSKKQEKHTRRENKPAKITAVYQNLSAENAVVEGKTENSKRKNIFKRIFKRKSKRDEEQFEKKKQVVQPDEIQAEAKQGKAVQPAPEKKQPSYKLKKVYAIQSVRYIYKQVENLNEKCKQLLVANHSLFVATNTGLYQIKDHRAYPVLKNCYVNYIARSRNPKRLFIGTSNGLFSVWLGKEIIKTEEYFKGFNENVYSLVEDDRHHLWVGCENAVYDIMLDKNARPYKIKPYEMQSMNSEYVLVRSVYGRPFFFLSDGVYSYDEKKDTIFFNEKINRRFKLNSRFIFSQESITWVYDGKSWKSLNSIADLTELDETFLDLFDDIQNIYVDEQKNIWVIDGSNHLYKIFPSSGKFSRRLFNVYIKQVSSANGSLFSISDLELDYEHNSLAFRISAPYYIKKEGTEYQYIVEGLMKNWSKWSSNPYVELPFIPHGSYRFRVRARNVFGELSKEKSFSFRITPPFWNSSWFIILCTFIAITLFFMLLKFRERNLKRTKRLLEEKVRIRTSQLEMEKEKSDELLLNILPQETAEELKTKGKATAKHYNMVSVMFTDFKGFTQIAENIKAEALVTRLDECFIKFDDIIDQYKLEKIKTIGDAYMCAGGIPVSNQTNPITITLAALEIREFMHQLKEEKKREEYWKIRIGIHTGPLIAGVVGKKKFAYDIWGDTVNTASRMESSSVPGMINISGATYSLIDKYFNCEFRGKIEAKNKGKIDMYFVHNIRSKYASDKLGLTPNELLLEMIK